jgi:hypothetical protein
MVAMVKQQLFQTVAVQMRSGPVQIQRLPNPAEIAKSATGATSTTASTTGTWTAEDAPAQSLVLLPRLTPELKFWAQESHEMTVWFCIDNADCTHRVSHVRRLPQSPFYSPNFGLRAG